MTTIEASVPISERVVNRIVIPGHITKTSQSYHRTVTGSFRVETSHLEFVGDDLAAGITMTPMSTYMEVSSNRASPKNNPLIDEIFPNKNHPVYPAIWIPL